VTEILVYATQRRAATVRSLLGSACQAVGTSARLELFGSGSLFQRLRARRAPPPPDLVMWFGPYAAHSAALDGLLQPYQPQSLPREAVHDPEWRWLAVDFQGFSISGGPAGTTLQDLATAPRLAMADPERSEVGMAAVLAVLDRARQVDGDPEPGWAWWQRRAQSGVLLYEEDGDALEAQRAGRASHALTIDAGDAPLGGLPLLPHAMALPTAARNVDAARAILDWVAGQAQPAAIQPLLDSAPHLDVDWATREYNAVRRRWAQSGFGPTLEA
jgi:ABC-type Fe3+ transport system substrate-binding protein